MINRFVSNDEISLKYFLIDSNHTYIFKFSKYKDYFLPLIGTRLKMDIAASLL